MKRIVALVLAIGASSIAISPALAGPGTGGRMGGGSWKSSGGGRTTSTPSTTYTPSHTYTAPTHTTFPTTDTSSFGGGHHWSDPTPHHDYTPAVGSTGSAVYVPDDFASHDSFTSHDSFDVMFWLFAIGVGIAIVGSTLFQRYQDRRWVMGGGDAPPIEDVDVSVLRVAIDGRARKFVQTELARIAKTADTSTDDGRVAMLREVALMLRRLRDAWIYGGAVNEAMGDIDREKSVFDHHVDDARVRFREETITNEQGVKSSTEASHYVPRSDEGAGAILVSIILAARRELFTVSEIASGENLRAALESAATLTTDSLIAVEIVWQPSEDSDRLSSIELEAKYPRPELIPIAGALVGKKFCAYCSGPFPAELVACPHCGAPAREAA